MFEKFRLRKVQLGGYMVWRLEHPSLSPLGRRYFWTWDGALRYVDRVTELVFA